MKRVSDKSISVKIKHLVNVYINNVSSYLKLQALSHLKLIAHDLFPSSDP